MEFFCLGRTMLELKLQNSVPNSFIVEKAKGLKRSIFVGDITREGGISETTRAIKSSHISLSAKKNRKIFLHQLRFK